MTKASSLKKAGKPRNGIGKIQKSFYFIGIAVIDIWQDGKKVKSKLLKINLEKNESKWVKSISNLETQIKNFENVKIGSYNLHRQIDEEGIEHYYFRMISLTPMIELGDELWVKI